jgi:major membrane immunogen (membrane-anchored lipoprotein)
MTQRGWKEFRTSSHPNALSFEILDGRFIRIRDRSMDDSGNRAYPVIDIQARKVVEGQTLYLPKNGRAKE